MNHVLKNPRIQELLRQAIEADTLRKQLEDPGELEIAFNGLLHDLGRALYQIATSSVGGELIPEDNSGLVTEEGYTDELPEIDDWYTNEVPRHGQGVFDEGDLPEFTETTDALGRPPQELPLAADTSETFELETIARMERQGQDPSSPLGELAAGATPTWATPLRELMQLLGGPPQSAAPQELAVEASRMQWATSELQTRLAGLPHAVQTCLVGMIAARSQQLRSQLDIDIGPRLSLDRLQRYRLQAELPAVAGLLPEPRPERGGWSQDAERWWALLQPEPPR